MTQKPIREEVTGLRERLSLVEQTLELTVAWQYGLRTQADELLDSLRRDAIDDTPARLDSLEAEIRTLRRIVQDLTQVVVSGVPGLAAMAAPQVPPRPRTLRGGPPPASSEVAPLAVPRAMTLARFDGRAIRGHSVGLTAVADGFADETEVVFEVGERGETGDTLGAPVVGGVASVTWWVPSTFPPGTELALVARIPPFESHASAMVERGPEEYSSDPGGADESSDAGDV